MVNTLPLKGFFAGEGGEKYFIKSVGGTVTFANKSIVQAVKGRNRASVHFRKKLQFSAQMISNMYSFDPDIAQSILIRLTPN